MGIHIRLPRDDRYPCRLRSALRLNRYLPVEDYGPSRLAITVTISDIFQGLNSYLLKGTYEFEAEVVAMTVILLRMYIDLEVYLAIRIFVPRIVCSHLRSVERFPLPVEQGSPVFNIFLITRQR